MGVLDVVTAGYNDLRERFANKVFDLAANSLTGTKAQFNDALSDGDFLTVDGLEAPTGKTIDLGSNTVTGTAAQFNTALSDADFVTESDRSRVFVSTLGDSPMWGQLVLSAIGTGVAPAAANSAIAALIRSPIKLALTGITWQVATQSGNYDLAVLDASGNRVWSKGSTACPAAGVVNETVTGVTIKARTPYFIVWAADNTTIGAKGLANTGASELMKTIGGELAAYSIATLFPIPTTGTIALGSTTTNRVPFFALRGTPA